MSLQSVEAAPRLESYPPGYIRLAFPEFRQLTFPKRMAFEDHDLRAELALQDLPVLSAGFCDWVDDTTALRVCVGWAWYRRFGDACGRLAPGGFSSNVMFVRRDGRPLGLQSTQRLLHAWLSMRPWQASIDLVHGPRYRLFGDRRH